MSIQDKIRDLLLHIPSARVVSGGREVLMRCKFCPDSNNPSHAHFYVSLGYDNTPFYFYCHKCHTKGILTYEKLLSWNIIDNSDTGVELIKYNKTMMSMSKNSKYISQSIYPLRWDNITNDRLSEVKLKYINNRLGTNLLYSDLIDNKIILNIKDILSTNPNIQKITRSQMIIDQLNTSFLGFLSYDNAFINLRCLTPGKVYHTIDKRYVNYSIFNKFDNTQKFYICPIQLNIMNPNRVKVHIAEGPFDVLSIKYNLRKEFDNNIYCAITGSGYRNMIYFFLTTIGLMNIEFHIYPDNDINLNSILSILDNVCPVYDIPLYIHTNRYPGEKDFGVRPEHIKEQIIQIY